MKFSATMIACIAACTLLGGCGRTLENEKYILTAQSSEEDMQATTLSESQPNLEEERTAGTVVVYICGQVRAPGVYELPESSRICDAVEAAGGLTDAASPDYWNLARPLADGEMIFFPTKEEAAKREKAAEVSSESAGISSDGRVNINTATLAQLMTLPGIGQTRGEAIVAYRSRQGAFSRVEDITQVPGIGNAVYENVRDYITVD